MFSLDELNSSAYNKQFYALFQTLKTFLAKEHHPQCTPITCIITLWIYSPRSRTLPHDSMMTENFNYSPLMQTLVFP